MTNYNIQYEKMLLFMT